MARREVTGIYSTQLKQDMDRVMAWSKTLLTIVMYAVGFISLNLADIITGGATIAKGLVSSAGPAMGYVLAFLLASAFSFIQLVMWNKIFDMIKNGVKRGLKLLDVLLLISALLLAAGMSFGDTVVDTAAIPIWLSASNLQAALSGVYVGSVAVYDAVYYALIYTTAALTGFGELFVMLYFDSADEAITVQNVQPLPKDVMSKKNIPGMKKGRMVNAYSKDISRGQVLAKAASSKLENDRQLEFGRFYERKEEDRR